MLAETPGVARAIFDAFAAAKAPYVDDLLAGRIPAPGKADKTYAAAAEILGGDPLPYGLAPNIGMLERMMDAAVAQGVLAAPADIAGLFAEDTREAVA